MALQTAWHWRDLAEEAFPKQEPLDLCLDALDLGYCEWSEFHKSGNLPQIFLSCQAVSEGYKALQSNMPCSTMERAAAKRGNLPELPLHFFANLFHLISPFLQFVHTHVHHVSWHIVLGTPQASAVASEREQRELMGNKKSGKIHLWKLAQFVAACSQSDMSIKITEAHFYQGSLWAFIVLFFFR